MHQLVIASVPLVQLTLQSYEANYYSLQMVRLFTKDPEQIAGIDNQISELTKMIDHCRNLLNNL